MFNFEFKWWEAILLIVYFIFFNIVGIPCFLLQKAGFKVNGYAKWLVKDGGQSLILYEIKTYK